MKFKIPTNKKGSYIVETAVTLPIFIIAIVIMSSIILMYVSIDNADFRIADEMRMASVKAEFIKSQPLLPVVIGEKIKKNNSQVTSYGIKEYKYLEKYGNIDKLIAVKLNLQLETQNPFDIASEAEYELALITRAYVGRERPLYPMNDAEMSSEEAEPVYIFPKSGKKYHNKNCTYIQKGAVAIPLTYKIKAEYRPCNQCKSGEAAMGSLVYIFPKYGDAYHLPRCPALERNYIEIDKKTAIRRGYTACRKCGG